MVKGFDQLEKERDWVNEDSNTRVAPTDESNRPVAIVCEWGRIEWQEDVTPHLGAKLYMSPPEQREWVGLTDEDTQELISALEEAVYLLNPTDKDMQEKAGVYRVVTALEKLKEKNT